jgi:hypothetical protein
MKVKNSKQIQNQSIQWNSNQLLNPMSIFWRMKKSLIGIKDFPN